MPFTPKFVDLVRNFTTIQGTGPVTLGASVTGFTSINDALSSGDQFYYCLQSVDKPLEREVGRGTLQADGKVARQPVQGGLTHFSSGTKTIGLVAAAEWFAKLEGGASGSSHAVDRAALAGRATAAGMAVLVEARREGLFVWDPSDLSARVAADPAQGLCVAPASAPSGAAGAWVRKFDGVVLPEWFGMVPDNVGAAAANVTAWNAMMSALLSIAFIPAANYNGLGIVRFGNAKYHFADSLDIDDGTVIIEGTASGVPNAIGTVLKFPAGKSGIRIQYFESSGTSGGPVAAHANSAGTVLRNLIVMGGFTEAGNVEGEFHGIVIRVPIVCDNVQAAGFQGDGFYVNAGATSATNRGNANLFRLVNCTAEHCRNGVFLAGADAGAYLIQGGSFDNNRQWGILEPDNASLGGVIDQVHFDANAFNPIPGIPSAMASHGGNHYGVIHGQEAGASVNAPSGTATDNAWWYWIGAGAGVVPAWASGTNYRSGGSVLCKSVNGTTVLRDCYSEGGAQPRSQVDAPNRIDGGYLSILRNVGSGPVRQPTYAGMKLIGSQTITGDLRVEGAENAVGPITATGGTARLQLRSSDAFSHLLWDFYTNGAYTRTNGSLVAWNNPGGGAGNKGLIYSADDTHFFKSGDGTLAGSAVVLTIGVAGIDLAAGKVVKVNGQQVIGGRAAAVADATDAASAITQLNALLARCRTHGLIAT